MEIRTLFGHAWPMDHAERPSRYISSRTSVGYPLTVLEKIVDHGQCEPGVRTILQLDR